MSRSLAIKYRPNRWEDVTEQANIKTILSQQLKTRTFKNAYLFCGGAGTGKTTCARIFANEINNHVGNPIEMDAASNSGVDDVRSIIQQAKTQSLDSEYKIFIIDECHSISNTGWQAFLKLIEEPPIKSMFIFCTTDPQKIPKTILSRVQRYDFKRISKDGIINRLKLIIECENQDNCTDFEHHTEKPSNWIEYEEDAVDYLAKMADGGMRDAITLMDKCLSFSNDLTLSNVVNALGLTDYDKMISLASSIIISKDSVDVIKLIDDIHYSGKDLKQFVKSFMDFMLDVNKYKIIGDMQYLSLPSIHEDDIEYLSQQEDCIKLLSVLIQLNTDIKWETSPKSLIEATLLNSMR